MLHSRILPALALMAAWGCGGSSTDGRDAELDDGILGEPRKLADVPSSGETVALHLYVSNQSFDISPVDIDVWLEGTHVVAGGFEVEGQHNWIMFDLAVPPGTRALHVEGHGGSVVLDEEVRIPEERWGVVDFWYYPGDPTHPMFTWHLSPVPVAFQ